MMQPIQKFPSFHIEQFAQRLFKWVNCCHFAFDATEKLLMNDVSQSIQYVEHSVIAHLNVMFAVPVNGERLSLLIVHSAAYACFPSVLEVLFTLRVFMRWKASSNEMQKVFLFVNRWDECDDLPQTDTFFALRCTFLQQPDDVGCYDLCETHFSGFYVVEQWTQCELYVANARIDSNKQTGFADDFEDIIR